MQQNMIDRRKFVSATALSYSSVMGANDRVRGGIIGAGGRGKLLTGEFKELSVEMAAVCDVYEPNLADGLKAASTGAKGYDNYKRMLDDNSLDVVVVAAELGHGKRNNVLSDYTFAVRDEASGELLPIGKAYSGLTDVEIAELTEHFKQNTIVDRGRYREVKPEIVLEVAFDSIQPSTRHASGLALRFPRIKAIRRDKNVDAIDTLAYARELAAESARG